MSYTLFVWFIKENKLKIFEIKTTNSHKIFSFCGLKMKFRKQMYKNCEKKIEAIEKKLIKKYKTEKINIVFMVCVAAMFPAKPLFEYLLNKEKYNAKILIVPDLRFGEEKTRMLYEQCCETLSAEFGEDVIIKAPLNKDDDDINIKNIADICFMSLPYDVSYEKYSLDNVINSGVLPACVNYAFYRAKYERERLISKPVYSAYWKVFTETKYNHEEFKKFSKNKAKNCVLTGYCKMDDYKKFENFDKNPNAKKTILIAPHHSVVGGYNDRLSLSNFYKYADLFLELPEKYPELNFIFRPHPALFICLENEKFWGKKKVDEYIAQMKSKKNVEFDENPNYLETFAKSDAIIQDCGSYLVEYFYTKKPQCYLLKEPKDIKEKFVKLGEKCLEQCYLAYNKEEIIDFIESVVVKEKDFKKETRENFAKNEVMYNYPNVSAEIYKYIDKLLGGEK